MYGIKFTVDCKDISFENFSIASKAYLDFFGSGLIFLEDFDNLLRKDELLDIDDFAYLIIEEYLADFKHCEDVIHFNQEDLDFAYKEYVKQYKNEWD